jgi:hypothetical protein
MISLRTVILKIITLTVAFTTALIITDDPCLPDHANILLSLLAISVNPANLS